MILDKEHFPRDKYCGDAVCTPALRILEDMGVMQVLRDANECHYADAGGFVSPSGLSYIGARRPPLARRHASVVAWPCTVAGCTMPPKRSAADMHTMHIDSTAACHRSNYIYQALHAYDCKVSG